LWQDICAPQQEEAMPAKPVLIKKYPNRRLYDTSSSKYINLDDIARFIREGRDVQVIDAESGDDLTRVTLTQIIMEDAKQPTGLPNELLKQLIVSSDRMGREFIMWYLKSAYDAYQTVQGKLSAGLHDVQAAAISPLNMVRSFIQSQMPAASTQHSSSSSNDELRQLRQRLAELEARMPAPTKSKSGAKRKPAKSTAKRQVAKKRR
jgi:polyhydroxyalkanoate synthesis repressor PhaR